MRHCQPPHPPTSTPFHCTCSSNPSHSKPPKNAGILRRSWSVLKNIIQDMSQTANYSFAKLTNSQHSPNPSLLNKRPSQMTMQLIRSIHCGFSPLEQSCTRWDFQAYQENSTSKEHFKDCFRNYSLSVGKPQFKRVVRIVSLQEPQPYNCKTQVIGQQSIAEGNIKLSQMQAVEKLKQAELIRNTFSSQQLRVHMAIERLPIENSVIQTNISSQCTLNNQSIKEQDSATHLQPKAKENHQQTTHQHNLPNISPYQQQPTNQEASKTQSNKHENKQVDAKDNQTTEKPNGDRFSVPVSKDSNPFVGKDSNPFLNSVKKALNFQDLLANNTSNMFNNRSQQVIPQIKRKEQTQASVFEPENSQLLANYHRLKNLIQIDKKPPNANTNFTMNQVSLQKAQENSLSQPKPLDSSKKGLVSNQIIKSSIYRSQNPQISDKKHHKGFDENQRVNFLTGINANNLISQQEVKQLFSHRPNQSKASEGPFSISSSRPRTAKKIVRNNRMHKNQTRIN